MAASNSTKNAVLGLAAVVILGVAIFIWAWPWPVEARFPHEVMIYGVCLETGEDVTLTVPITETPPYANSKNGKRTVYPWYFCHDCRHRFVLMSGPATATATQPDGTIRTRVGTIPVCPNCGGVSTGSWVPDDPAMEKPDGTVPPPPLPD